MKDETKEALRAMRLDYGNTGSPFDNRALSFQQPAMKTLAPYTPKPVRGIAFPGHIRINKRQLARLFQDPSFTFSGFIVGNNVNSFHFFNGWRLAHSIENRGADEMQQTLNAFAFYLEPELGSAPAIFLKS